MVLKSGSAMENLLTDTDYNCVKITQTIGITDELLYCGKCLQVKHREWFFQHLGTLQVPKPKRAVGNP